MAHGSLHLPFSFCAGHVFKPMDVGKRSSAGPRRPLQRAARKVNSFKLPRASAEYIVDSGSTPVLKDPEKVNGEHNCDCDNWFFSANGNDLLWSRLKTYHDRCKKEETVERNAGPSSFYKEFARYLGQVWMQVALAHKYYDKAFEREHRNGDLLIEYAEFVWKGMKNVEMAGDLLEKAVTVHDYADNVQVWGLYASIMWQADDV